MVHKDHTGLPSIKIVMHGPTRSGKTSALKVLAVLKKIEDPPRLISDLQSIRSPTGTTVFFDKATFLAGEIDESGKSKGIGVHLWATPGEATQSAQRDIVLDGANGYLLMLSAEPDYQEANRNSMLDLARVVENNPVPIEVVINKADMYTVDLDVILLDLVSTGLFPDTNSAREHTSAISVLKARDDLLELLQTSDYKDCLTEDGMLKRSCRPESVHNIVDPFRRIVSRVVTQILAQH